MTGPGLPTPAAPKKRPEWVAGGVTIICFVALLYVIEAIDTVMGNRLDQDGIRPLQADGLWGILWAPLLHGGWQHLSDNAGFILVLGFLVTLSGMGRFLAATAIIWILGGFGTWLIGNINLHCSVGLLQCPSIHIGASGLIMGWLTFLLVFGFFTRKAWQIIVGIIVLFVYGGVLLTGLFPSDPRVSWQGHLCGAVAGVVAAYALSGRERKARESRRQVQPRLTS